MTTSSTTPNMAGCPPTRSSSRTCCTLTTTTTRLSTRSCPGFSADPPSSILGGEELLARVYSAIRASSTEDGSNFANTLFLVAFDEHGGTYDHVPPPSAPPPDPAAPPGQMGFRFDRSGVRIPTLAISAYIDAKTVVTEEYRNTSLIRTLRERFSLGPPLTGRDAVAADIAPILTRDAPRPQEDWPEVTARPVPPLLDPMVQMDKPLPRSASTSSAWPSRWTR